MATIEAKLFGGACLTPQIQRRDRGARSDGKPLGDENIEHAIGYLRECSIPVCESATGGWRGRKVVFRTSDGHAHVKVL